MRIRRERGCGDDSEVIEGLSEVIAQCGPPIAVPKLKQLQPDFLVHGVLDDQRAQSAWGTKGVIRRQQSDGIRHLKQVESASLGR
jgi:hypothetical protein